MGRYACAHQQVEDLHHPFVESSLRGFEMICVFVTLTVAGAGFCAVRNRGELREDARHDYKGQQRANDGFGRCGKRPVVELQSFEHCNLFQFVNTRLACSGD